MEVKQVLKPQKSIYTKSKIVLFVLIAYCFTNPTIADTLSFQIEDQELNIQNILSVQKENDLITYYDISKGFVGLKEIKRSLESKKWSFTFNGRYYKADSVKVIKSSKKEQKQILKIWKQRTLQAVVDRGIGPKITLVAFGLQYPLTAFSRGYLSAGATVDMPDVEAFYIGETSESATKIYFKEIKAIETYPAKGKDQKKKMVRIYWKSGNKSESILLTKWRYLNRDSLNAEIFGMNPDTLSIFKIPLTNIKKLEVVHNGNT